MGKIKETRQLYKEVLNEISKSAENWTNFLDSSSWNFKYDFDDQILIYAQRPDAKACATMDEWNKKLKRWVNSGTKPIYIFEKSPHSDYPFKLVFDLSDTHNYNNTEYKLWTIKEDYQEDIIDSLEANFGDISSKETLSQAIIQVSYNMVVDNIEDYLTSVINHKSNSMLQNFSDEEIRGMLITTACASVSYMMMTRCGINAKEQIQEQEFSYIKYFNTPEVLTILGASVSDIGEMGLREIAKTVSILQKKENLKNRTFAKKENELYSKDNKKIEGGIEDGRENRIHETGRLLHAELNNEEGNNTTREILSNEIQLSEESQEPRVDHISNGTEIDRTFDRDTGTSNEKSREDSGRYEETRGDNGGIESSRPNEMGSLNEQHQVDSRGNSSERVNLQLEENISQRRTLSKKEIETNRDFLKDKYTSALLSNIQNLKVSKNDIKEFYKTHSNINERTEYIKQAFNDAYTEIVVDDTRLGYKTYENVLHLWKDNYTNRTAEVYYNWDTVAEYIEGLILVNEFNDLHKPLLSLDDQMQILQVEAANAPTFSFTQEIIDYALQGGGNVHQSKMRIYNQFENSLSSQENIKFLKNEYGWGGSSSIHIGTRVGIDYDGKGIKLRRGYRENDPQIVIPWNKVEKRISELIKADRYLNSKEKEQYSNWLKQKELEEQLRESKKQLLEEKTKPLEEQLLKFFKEHDVFKAEYSDDENIDLTKIRENLRNFQAVTRTIDYLKRIKSAEDTNEILIEQIDYFIGELTKINEDNREQNIAERISSFIKDFDFYNYMDNTEFYRSNVDNIAIIKADINDSMNIKDYVRAIKRIINDVDLDNDRLEEANELLNILEERLPKYEYHLGDTVYIGADEYEIAEINDNSVTLFDVKFPLLNKQMDFEEFERKVQDNYANDHLKAENRNISEIELNKEKLSNIVEQKPKEETQMESKTFLENIFEKYEITDYGIRTDKSGEIEGIGIGDVYYSHVGALKYLLDVVDEHDEEFYGEDKRKITNALYRARQKEKQEIINKELEYENSLHTVIEIQEETEYDDLAVIQNNETKVATVEPVSFIKYLLKEQTIQNKEKVIQLNDEILANLFSTLVADQHIDINILNDSTKSFDEKIQMLKEKCNEYYNDFGGFNPTDGYVSISDEDINITLYENDSVHKLEWTEFSRLFIDYAIKEKETIKQQEEKRKINEKEALEMFLEHSMSYSSLTNLEKQTLIDINVPLDKKINIFKDMYITGAFEIENVYYRIVEDGLNIRLDHNNFHFEWDTLTELFVEYLIEKNKEEKLFNIEDDIKPNFIKTSNKIQDFILHPEVSINDRNNYKITDNDLGIGTVKEKFARNIEAIKVLKKCEQENRYATPEEQEILSKYVGWGGLQQAFKENENGWIDEYNTLKELLNEEEYKNARASTLTAFYTPPIVINAMYEILQNMGLKEANILEPSCGVGNFFGMLPKELENCKMYGIELDSISGRIAQQLYQKSTIAVNAYEKVELPDSFFDVAIRKCTI